MTNVTPDMLQCLAEVNDSTLRTFSKYKTTVEGGSHILMAVLFGIVFGSVTDPEARAQILSKFVGDLTRSAMLSIHQPTPPMPEPKEIPDASRS